MVIPSSLKGERAFAEGFSHAPVFRLFAVIDGVRRVGSEQQPR